MEKYEVLVAISEDISEEELKKSTKDLERTIEKFGGKIEKIDEWGKKPLAFPIGKNKNAYYLLIRFIGDSKLPKNLEDKLRINENLLRYLITKEEKEYSKVEV